MPHGCWELMLSDAVSSIARFNLVLGLKPLPITVPWAGDWSPPCCLAGDHGNDLVLLLPFPSHMP